MRWRTRAPGGPRQPVLLGRMHLDHLATPGEHRDQVGGLGIRQRAWGWLDRGREVGQHLGIERIGLGEPPRGLGEVAHLARIDHGHGQPRGAERAGGEPLQAPGGFEHDQGGGLALESALQGGQPGGIVGHGPTLLLGSHGDDEGRLGHIDSDKHGWLRHTNLLPGGGPVPADPALQDTGLPGAAALATVRVLGTDERDDPRSPTVFVDLGPSGLSRPGSHQ